MYFYENSVDWQNLSDISRIFSDEQLYVLGITRGYVNYFNQKRNEVIAEKLELIRENVKNYSVERKNQISMLSVKEYSINRDVRFIYKVSLMQLQNPDTFKNNDIYFWMGMREHVYDVPELQKFKLFPCLDIFSSDVFVPQLRVKKYLENKDWNILAYCRKMGVEYPQL